MNNTAGRGDQFVKTERTSISFDNLGKQESQFPSGRGEMSFLKMDHENIGAFPVNAEAKDNSSLNLIVSAVCLFFS